MTLHLTHEQLCDLILADASLAHEDDLHNESSDSDIVHTHLQACLICSAELRSLRDSLAHFRDASVSYARQEFAQSYAQRSSITPPHSFLSQPLLSARSSPFLPAPRPMTISSSSPLA